MWTAAWSSVAWPATQLDGKISETLCDSNSLKLPTTIGAQTTILQAVPALPSLLLFKHWCCKRLPRTLTFTCEGEGAHAIGAQRVDAEVSPSLYATAASAFHHCSGARPSLLSLRGAAQRRPRHARPSLCHRRMQSQLQPLTRQTPSPRGAYSCTLTPCGSRRQQWARGWCPGHCCCQHAARRPRAACRRHHQHAAPRRRPS